MLQHVDRVHLEIAVEEIVTVSTSHVIQDTAHALLVDVKVDIKAVLVVQVCDIYDQL